jgi:hypothetical protein
MSGVFGRRNSTAAFFAECTSLPSLREKSTMRLSRLHVDPLSFFGPRNFPVPYIVVKMISAPTRYDIVYGLSIPNHFSKFPKVRCHCSFVQKIRLTTAIHGKAGMKVTGNRMHGFASLQFQQERGTKHIQQYEGERIAPSANSPRADGARVCISPFAVITSVSLFFFFEIPF